MRFAIGFPRVEPPMEAGVGLLDLLRMQKADAEERLHDSELTSEMRELDQVYLAEIERLLAVD